MPPVTTAYLVTQLIGSSLNAVDMYVNRCLNALMGTGNYSATSNKMKLVHWPLMGGLYVTFGTARRGLGGAPAWPGPSWMYQM